MERPPPGSERGEYAADVAYSLRELRKKIADDEALLQRVSGHLLANTAQPSLLPPRQGCAEASSFLIVGFPLHPTEAPTG